MLLRNLTKHVKDQNWFAVALDFFIVVVGILLAFQITNWSAARQDNQIYEQARIRVIEEAKANLVLSQDAIQDVNTQQNQAVIIIRDFETCSAEGGAEERLMRSMQSLRFFMALEVRNAAINQFLTSDEFLDNISPEDRTVLSVYARKIDTLASNSRFSDSVQLNQTQPQDNPIFKRTHDEGFSGGLTELALTVSYEQACRDTVLNHFLFDRLDNAAYIMRLAKSLENASREVLMGLGENLPETTVEATQ